MLVNNLKVNYSLIVVIKNVTRKYIEKTSEIQSQIAVIFKFINILSGLRSTLSISHAKSRAPPVA